MSQKMKAAFLASHFPQLIFNNGFHHHGETRPFFSFNQEQKINWSSEMGQFLEEGSKEHFIDKYNRQIVLDHLRHHLGVPGKVYADIGCSTGHLLEEVTHLYPQLEIIGSDFEPAALIQAHKKFPSIPLFQFDLAQCPLPDNCLDALSCLNVLEHLNDDVRAAQHLVRILRPGGKLVVTVPAAPHLYDFYDEIHFHKRRYQLDGLKSLFSIDGFRITWANYMGCLLYPAFYAVKRRNQRSYNHLGFEQKKQMAFAQAHTTRSLPIMDLICNAERTLGKFITFPWGVRACLVGEKVN